MLKVEKRRDLVYLTASENASDTMEEDRQQRLYRMLRDSSDATSALQRDQSVAQVSLQWH